MTNAEVVELLKIVDEIAELDRKRRKLNNRIREIIERTGVIVARVELDIAMLTDENGKRIYSNEGMRRAERTLRLGEHEEYQKLKQNRKELEDEQGEIIIEYNRLVYRRLILMLAMGLDPDSFSTSLPDEIPH